MSIYRTIGPTLVFFSFGNAEIMFCYPIDEVPMTPKTPMPYSQIHYDDHRTPGQILSLRSSFAFVSMVDSSPNDLSTRDIC